MSNLKNEKHQEHTRENRAHYVRQHVSSVKSLLFAEIDRDAKNKRPRRLHETLEEKNKDNNAETLTEDEQDLIFPLDLPEPTGKTPPLFDLKRNFSTETQRSDAQTVSTYASSVNIIIHKEKDPKTEESITTYERIYKQTSIFSSPVKHSEPMPIGRSTSAKSESFCHSIFQTPSPTKSASPEKLKIKGNSGPDLLPFTAPTREHWDFLEHFRKMEQQEERLMSSAGFKK
jgi:hypothetical protein